MTVKRDWHAKEFRRLETPVDDQPLDLVQQGRHLLHFVNDHRLLAGRLGQQFLPQQRRTNPQPAVLVRQQQIVAGRFGKQSVQQRALAGLARAPEKTRFPPTVRQCLDSIKHDIRKQLFDITELSLSQGRVCGRLFRRRPSTNL